MTTPNGRQYAGIITTIALALFAVFWTQIDGQLRLMDSRLRCLEREVAAISARLGIEPGGSAGSQNPPAAAGCTGCHDERPAVRAAQRTQQITSLRGSTGL